MRQEVAQELDRIDQLEAGQGMIEAYLFGRGTLDAGSAGAGVQYGHKLNDSWSAILRGEAGYHYGQQRGFGYSGQAAIRGVW